MTKANLAGKRGAEAKWRGRGLKPFGTNLAQMTRVPSRNTEMPKVESEGNP